MVELPAGEIGPRETPEKAAVRELGEETGYKCRKLTYAGKKLVSADRNDN